jgi:alpha-1,3-glucan synthase
MISNKAWQRHGCYTLGSQQYFNMPLEKALLGCQDDWNSLDHFDPTSDTRRIFGQFMYLRSVYNALQDGFNLVQRGNWTYFIQRPGSNDTATEVGLWSVSRSGIPGVQTLTGNRTDQIWLLYTNENTTKTYNFDCKENLWISSPYQSGTTVQNLFAPYETYQLQDSLSSFNNDSKAPWQGCLPNITMEGFGFKALVPQAVWVAPLPALTKFTPGHDARIQAQAGDANATNVDIALQFNVEMNCNSVTSSISFNMSSSGKGGNPSINQNSIKCAAISNPDPSAISAAGTSAWSWSATIQDVSDGVLTLTVKNPAAQNGNVTTGVVFFPFHVCFT